MAAGLEDSTVVLWSLNGYENYGRKPFQSLDDRLCQWSINNCNRTLTDDLSDFESEDEIVTNLNDACDEDETESEQCSSPNRVKLRPRRTINKYKKKVSTRQQWEDYASKSCTENNL